MRGRTLGPRKFTDTSIASTTSDARQPSWAKPVPLTPTGQVKIQHHLRAQEIREIIPIGKASALSARACDAIPKRSLFPVRAHRRIRLDHNARLTTFGLCWHVLPNISFPDARLGASHGEGQFQSRNARIDGLFSNPLLP